MGSAGFVPIAVDGANLFPPRARTHARHRTGIAVTTNAALHGLTEHDAGTAAGVQRSVDQLGGAPGLSMLVGISMGITGAGGSRTAFLYAPAVVCAAAVGLLLAGRATARPPAPGAPVSAPTGGRDQVPGGDGTRPVHLRLGLVRGGGFVGARSRPGPWTAYALLPAAAEGAPASGPGRSDPEGLVAHRVTTCLSR
ncbi:hypothetical protein [Streptomyces atroolivaceus]|uniref:hypothetical protein n=1 Tax=Streptomyces atroolivaceus TaxID=66869 RepID=UPI003636E9BF